MKALAFIHGNDPIFANLFHGVGEQIADGSVIIGSDRGDVSHFGLVFDLDRHLAKAFGNVSYSSLNTSLHLNGIDTCNNSLQAFVENRFGHHSRGSGTIACNVAGLACHFANHSSAHVFIDVFEIDLFCNGNTVFGDGWASKALLQNDVASLRTQGHLYCASQFRDPAANCFAGFLIKSNNLCHRTVELRIVY